jgi:hypothetical protein
VTRSGSGSIRAALVGACMRRIEFLAPDDLTAG